MIAPQSGPKRRTLKARYVFPVAAGPIGDGTVTVEGERIAAVGGKMPEGEVLDLGNAAILPGLVNAHTHLEFSDLAEPLGRPGIDFVAWIEAVIRLRREARGRAGEPVELGLQESIRAGTTALGEIAQPGWKTEPFEQAPLEATVLLELIAPSEGRVPAAIESAKSHVEAAGTRRPWHPGLCPHAPYSVHPELLRRLVAVYSQRRVPIAFHLAESREEIELLRFRSGPLRDFLGRIEGWDPSVILPSARPLDYLRMLSPVRRLLVIHGNYLDDEEIALVADCRDRMAVVYCPRTHAYFGHDEYPLAKFLSAGVTVALGTDSRASSPDLSVLAEMRLVARRGPPVPPAELLRLGTLSAARALGLDAEAGSLEAGKWANLAVVRLPDRDAADPHELLFDSDAPVVATWFRGERIGEAGGLARRS